VTDANGCTSTTTGNITEPTTLQASSSNTAIKCHGGNSTVTVSATGGTAPYSGTGNFTVTAGSYSYSVTDANGCTSTTTGNITEPTALQASSSNTEIKCHGDNSIVTVSATGGTAPYTGTGDFTVSAGPYSYTVTDANGCTSTTSGTITEPDVLAATAAVSSPVACNGGDATVSVSATGGTTPYSGIGDYTVKAGPYSYTVTDAKGCISTITGTVTEPDVLLAGSSITTAIVCHGGKGVVTVSATGGTTPYSGTGTFTVYAGAYSFTVTDAHGCTSTTSGTATEPDAFTVTVSTDKDPNICTGNTVTLTANSGTAWTWSDNETTQSIIVNASGNYTVTATNEAGCPATSDATAVVVTPLPDPGMNVSGPTTFCSGGSVTLTANTGSTYSWSPNGETTPSITVTASGTYTVTVSNGNGCQTVSSTTVTANPLPATPYITSTGSCSPATLTANGNSDDRFSWSNDNGPSLQSGNSINVSTTGMYYLSETDGNGCTSSTSQGYQVYSTPVAGINAHTTWVNFNCYKYALLQGTSNINGVSYSWSTNSDGSSPFSTNQSVVVTPGNSTTHQSSYTYYLTISNHGCTSTASVTITVNYDNCYDCGTGNGKNATSTPHKVTFCQCGKPNVSICVDTASIPAHIAHGDHFGTCTSTNYSCGAGSNLFENMEGNSVNIFPNPFTSVTNIDIRFAESQQVAIDIMSLDGKIVKTIYSGMVEKDMPYHFQYDGSATMPGIYLARFVTNNQVEIKKIQVLR
jgi:hypothetical protein